MNLKTLKASLLTIAANLGLAEKTKKGELTNEDFEKMNEAFKEEHGMSFMEAIDKAKKNGEASKQLEEIKSLFAEPQNKEGEEGAEGGEGEGEGEGEGNGSGDQAPASVINQIKEMQQKIKTLSEKAEADPKETVSLGKPKVVSFAHTENHAFGVESDLFSRNRSWNENAVNRTLRNDRYAKDEKEQLMADFDTLGKKIGQRWRMLHENNELSRLGELMAAGDIDYSGLSELGDEYLVRRMDTIITYIRKLESISKYFPLRSNVQDAEAVVHNFMGKSLSQPFQAGEVFAGSSKFQGEKYRVYDVMIKMKFHDLKDLEREYIGYLNTEGSSPIKWSFIEWIMVQAAQIAHNERELRRVFGVRVEPTTDSPAFFMYAAPGIVPSILDKVDENAAWQFADLNTYDSTTIVDYVRSFVREVYRMNNGMLKDMVLVMNSLHKPDFLEGYRTAYGTDANYAGEKAEVKDFPLPIQNIVGINMGESHAMFMMRKNTIELLEDKPGEMFSFYFERRLEQLIAASYAKEGVHVGAGRKFDTKAALLASKGKQTNVFINHPVTELADGDTTADATSNHLFQSVENSGATALTDFVGAVEGVAYRLYCGNTTNATTIAKSGKFSEITAAYTPSAVGDYLEVIYNPTTSKFIELKRKVGGTVTVNGSAKAPAYVEQV